MKTSFENQRGRHFMSCCHISSALFIVIVSTAALVREAYAQSTIDSNSFQFYVTGGTQEIANDFHMYVDGHFLGADDPKVKNPSSDVFPNVMKMNTTDANGKKTATAWFRGATLTDGQSHNVKFMVSHGQRA
jgi:hypothetical protein